MKPLVWTIRIEGDAAPCTWLLHEGPRSVAMIEEAVARATQEGLTVIVGLSTTKVPR